MAARSPFLAALQIVSFSALAALASNPDAVAQSLIQFTAGTMVTSPSRNGNNTRRKRWESNDLKPRPRQSMAVKKPLSTKNTGMRKPWIAANNSQKKPLCRSF